jgi:hypothetical protein
VPAWQRAEQHGDAAGRGGRLSVVRHAVAVVLVGVAALLLAAATNLAYGLSAAYGADTVQDGGWTFLVLVPGALALLCLLGARDPDGRTRPRTSALAVGVLVVFAVTVSGAAAYGGSVHERNLAARTTACSPEDIALLKAVDAPGARTEPAGEDDGGCSMVVSWVPDAAVATARVVGSVQRGGWHPVAREGEERVFRRGDAVLRLSVVGADSTSTDVRLTLD